MNKRGRIRYSKIGIALGVTCVLVLLLISSILSSAILEKEEYQLGESVKIDLGGKSDYKLKIKTPTTMYVKQGSDDVFIFKASELGTHTIVLDYEEKQELYQFTVVKGKIQEKPSISEEKNETPDTTPVVEGKRELVEKVNEVPRDLPLLYANDGGAEISFKKPVKKWKYAIPFKIFKTKIDATIYDQDGAPINVDISIDETPENITTTIEETKSFQPGVYTLDVEYGGETYEETFAWGLVSVNTKKSIYKPGEQAELILVVLDSEGRGVCNAPIELTVTDPENISILLNDKISADRDCGLYYAPYTVENEGEYSISIHTIVDDMMLIFETNFSVRQTYDYDIIRAADSKIDPTKQSTFTVSLNVTALQGATDLVVKEYVPKSFAITHTDAKVTIDDDSQILEWQIPSSTATISYTYAVPPIWPYLYALGTATVNDFEEARPWYIAVDPAIQADNESSYDIALVSLDNQTFVVAWVDAREADVSFIVYNTTGSNLTSIVDVDTAVDSNSRVALTALNRTTFIIGWYDGVDEDVTYAFYTRTGAASVAATDMETTVGNPAVDIKLASMQTQFIACYFDDAEGDADARVVTYATLGAGTEKNVDTNAAPDVALNNLVDCATMNTTRTAYVFFDDNQNDITYAILNHTADTIVGPTDLDTGAGNGGEAALVTLDNDKVVIGWVDSGGTDASSVSLEAHDANGAHLFNTTIDANAGTLGYRLSMTTVNSSAEKSNWFVVAWNDQNASAILGRVYNSSGTLKYGTFTLATDENTTSLLFDVFASESFRQNLSICQDQFLFAYTNTTGRVVVKTLNLDGSLWSGVCGETDTTGPNITLVSPLNRTNITDSFGLDFIYTLTDNSAINNCSLIVDGTRRQSDTSISKDTNQTFSQYLTNGVHNWSVQCFDEFNNSGYSINRTVNVTLNQGSFTGRFYETFFASYSGTQTAYIWLNNTRDAVQDTAAFDIPSDSLQTMVIAPTYYMSNNGAVIPGGANITFSSSFSTTNANVRITWKLYLSNSTGDTLLCQNGNDGSSGIAASAGTITGSNASCLSAGLRLQSSDRLLYVINGYAAAGATRSITHSWDGATSSFVDINVSSEGFLNLSLISPTSDPNILTGQTFNISCQVVCTIGVCRNPQVYVQYNTSSTSWTDISSSGNLVLAGSETNPHSLGNLSTTPVITNFSIQGSLASVNNIRCRAVSTYDALNGTATTQVTVTGAQLAPIVNLTTPVNATFLNSSTVRLFYNVTDTNNNIANATLIINGAINITNTSAVLNGQISNFTLVLQDGFYHWNVNVTDQTSLVGIDNVTRLFAVDTRRPSPINLSAPQPNQTFTTSTIEFNITVLDNLDLGLVCNITIDSVVVASNFNVTNNTMTNRTISGISIATHFWNATCIDDAGNVNTSRTINFTVSDLPPTVTLVTTNNTYRNIRNITLFYNASDNNGFRSSVLILNGIRNATNTTLIVNNANTSNFTLVNLADGVYNWTVNVTDTAGFNATFIPEYVFTIDTQRPLVNLTTPSNNTQSNSSTIIFNFTVTDSRDTSLVCNLTAGIKSDLSFAAANGSLISRTLSGFNDTLIVWNVTCVDDAGNVNTTERRTIRIAEPPGITLVTANNSFFNTTTFNLTYTPSDNTNLSRCDLYINGVFNKSNGTAIANGQQNGFNQTLQQGIYQWFVICNDTSQYQNRSVNQTFTVDTQRPSINLSYPSPGSNVFELTVGFNSTVIDNLDTNLSCNLSVDSTLYAFTALNGTVTTRPVTFITGGVKFWNVTCADDAGNWNISATINFTLSFPPVVNLTSPTTGTYTNSSTVRLFYNVTDANDNIANATLIINGAKNATNTSLISNGQINNFTLVLQDGVYNWTVNVTDTTSLTGTDTVVRSITVDTRRPLVTMYLPAANSNLTSNSIDFNFSVIDNLDTNITCNLSIDGTVEIENIPALNDTNVTRNVLRGDGTYSWNLDCVDDTGNRNVTVSRNFTIEAPPLVTLSSPENNSFVNSTTVTFAYTPEDALGIANCSLFLDGRRNTTDDIIESNQINNFLTAGIPEGFHNWTVECFDAFPDFNNYTAQLRNFTIDITAPNVTLLAPANNTNTLKSVYFNISATDNLDTTLNCTLYVDGIVNASSISVANASSTVVLAGNYTLGSHVWNATCNDEALNIAWSTKWTFNVTLPDLSINTTDITFNMSGARENDTVRINATIRNLENVTVTNITVQFYEGNPSAGGIQIGSNQTIASLAGLDSQTVNVTWSAKLGTTLIFVLVDPPLATNGTYEEWREDNNIANATIVTEGWHYLYGDLTPATDYELDDLQNLSIVRWDSVNFRDGNLYVVDLDSSINWASLKAFGKNLTGVNTTNDYGELDVFLNMTSFADSVNSTYLSNNTLRNASSFNVFNRVIQNVPCANSTNNTNFMTGILWDSSDDTNGEYSSADKEDIVFISRINKDQPGKYGLYDYEVRIPASLRNYRQSDTRAVAFYTEVV